MKPFNLEAALRGEKVVTRSGTIVSDITYFENAAGSYKLVAVINSDIYRFSTAGEIFSHSNAYDLFMATTKKKGWINLYKNKNNSIDVFYCEKEIFKSKEEALNNVIDPFCKHISVIEIEWDE